MTKLLFLDIDGVLNSLQTTLIKPILQPGDTRNPIDELDTILLNLLKLAIDETDAKIIITSTWRKEFELEEIQEFFKRHGWENVPIIDFTPITLKNFRGEEVALYLEQFTQDHELEAYVIVDDSSDYYLNDNLQSSFRFNQPLVRTDARIGFSYKDLLGVLYYLNPKSNLVKPLKEEANFKSSVHVETPWLL